VNRPAVQAMKRVDASAVPAQSALQARLAQAQFADAYRAGLTDPDLTPTEIFLRAARATPRWVGVLMAIRNRAVRLVGLKDVGQLGAHAGKRAAAYQVGDRLGIFHVFGITDEELVLGIDDRHLDVRVSVCKPRGAAPPAYIVSTVVTVHNRLGRLYMIPVGRIHPLVVRAMMRRAVV
jgi:hypothetical protein